MATLPRPADHLALWALIVGLSACAVTDDVHPRTDGSFTVDSEDGNGMTGFSGLLEINRRRAPQFCQERGQDMAEVTESHEGAVFFVGTADELYFRCIAIYVI